jgi:hypothetical protein
MRYDVNFKKENVEALLPKGVGLPKLLKDNFHQYFFSTTLAPPPPPTTLEPRSSKIDHLKQHYLQNFMINNNNNNNNNHDDDDDDESQKTITSIRRLKVVDLAEHTWQSLNYFHWLNLFSNYNVSLYNRYVAILPQINLDKEIKHADIVKYRNVKETQKYSSVITNDDDDDESFNVNNNNKYHQHNKTQSISTTVEYSLILSYKRALNELFGIVVFGIPTILIVVYLTILFYKCLCSKNYEQWRRSWSTSNIKEQYKIIHSNDYSSDEFVSDAAEEEYIDIDRIINGQKDQIEMRPLKTLSFNDVSSSPYSIDLIASGNYRFVTADLNNQINVWSL